MFLALALLLAGQLGLLVMFKSSVFQDEQDELWWLLVSVAHRLKMVLRMYPAVAGGSSPLSCSVSHLKV